MHSYPHSLFRCAPARLTILALCAISACVLAACGDGGDDTVAPGSLTVSGALSGLEQNKTIVLQNNGSDDLALSANGAFVFAHLMVPGSPYAVTVKSQPAEQTCLVANGNGTAVDNVGNVSVVCSLGGGGSGSKLASGVPGLLGDWLENGCVTIGGQSYKRLVRAAKKTDTSISYSQGISNYPNENCSGPASVVGPQSLGDVVFSRSESNDRIAANWGEFTTVTNTVSPVIWAKKSETVLCLLGDEKPSIQPTLEAVESSLSTLSALGCFTKQP